MKKSLFTLAALIATTNLATAQASNYPAGSTVADFTVTDTDGNVINLYSITASGKYVMLDFFFDTCGPCQTWQPTFSELYDKYGCNTGDLFCLSINNGSDDDAMVEAYEATYGGPFHHAPAVSTDGGCTAVDAAFGVGAYPTFCLIGPDNKMIVNDVWPLTNLGSFEAVFPEPLTPMACSFASLQEEVISYLSIYPNPANQEAVINFYSGTSSTATIEIYSLLGEKIMTTSASVVTGNNTISLDVADLATGQYIVQLNMDEAVQTIKFNVAH